MAPKGSSPGAKTCCLGRLHVVREKKTEVSREHIKQSNAEGGGWSSMSVPKASQLQREAEITFQQEVVVSVKKLEQKKCEDVQLWLLRGEDVKKNEVAWYHPEVILHLHGDSSQ